MGTAVLLRELPQPNGYPDFERLVRFDVRGQQSRDVWRDVAAQYLRYGQW
jgi:hypothetical protein